MNLSSDWLRELRFSARSLRRRRGLSATVVITLGLGIGINCVLFSFNRAMARDAIPFADPERLVMVTETVQRDRLENRALSFPNFADLRAQARGFERLAVYDSTAVTVDGGRAEVPERLTAERVSDGYFATLAVEPARGRWLEGESEADQVVLGESLAVRLFGDAGAAVGRVMRVDARPHEVVGVMPAAFGGASDRAELWIPLGIGSLQALDRRTSRFLSGIGRLAPTASMASARSELATRYAALAAEHTRVNRGYSATADPLDEVMLGSLRDPARALFACVGFVLVVACFNLANLLICRTVERSHENAVRRVLGAGRWRLLRQAVAEVGLLALGASLLGWLVALWGLELLPLVVPVTLPSFVSFRFDLETLAFALGLAVAAFAFMTVATAIGTARRRRGALRLGPRATTDDLRTRRLRAGLVAGQVALALALAIGAGLLARSLLALSAVDLGFQHRQLTYLRVDQPDDRPDEARMQLVRDLGEALRALPGATAAGFASDLPLDGLNDATVIAPEGRPPDPDAVYGGGVRVYRHRVDDAFFRALGIPLLDGRTFEPTEIGADARVAVISQDLARRLWPGGAAVGKRLRRGAPSTNADEDDWMTVVGVVGDVRYRTLVDRPGTPLDPDLYLPIGPAEAGNLAVAVHHDRRAPPTEQALRATLRRIDPAVPLYATTALEELVARRTGSARMSAMLMSSFALMALLLCAIGVHGTVAYAVARRTREIGIRIAVGSTRGGVVRLLIADGLKLVTAGSALGLAAGLAVVRLVEGQLVGVGAVDAASFLGATSVVAVSALVASALPARRASRLDPIAALRVD